MPLETLSLTVSRVSDISFLKGMPLRTLFLSSTQVTDLGPLSGMALAELLLRKTPVSDIHVLEGMPLTHLNLDYTDIRDISVLRGMPLKQLGLYGCKFLHDLGPLAECKQLEKLAIPEQCEEIGFLRALPDLKWLDNQKDLWYLERSATDFWREWDERKTGD